MEAFQLALFQHNQEDQSPLYSPALMRDFAEEHASGLYDMLLNAIIHNNTSPERRQLQEQRTVALLHIIAYFR